MKWCGGVLYSSLFTLAVPFLGGKKSKKKSFLCKAIFKRMYNLKISK